MTNDRPAIQPITSRSVRLFLIYRTALAVLASYATLRVTGWVRSANGQRQARDRCHRRNARRVCRTITRVGGLFVKVGQLLSVLTSALPETFRRELEGLQDALPERPAGEIAARIEDELGAAPDSLFATFADRPLASASLAQVHAATLADGRKVAVKVQHRDIEALAERDLATMRNLVRIAQLVLRVRGFHRAFGEIRIMILEELDFTREAEHLRTVADVFADDPMIACPEVVPDRSSARVLTTTFVEGTKVTDLEELDAIGIDRRAVAERIVHAYGRMIMNGGVYHADPHPGNLLVRPDGGVVLLDFGAVSQLSPALANGLPAFLHAVLRRDHDAIVRALERMGFVAHGDDRRAVAEQIVAYVYRTLFAQIEVESWNLAELHFDPKMKVAFLAELGRQDISLRELTDTFQVPREWILLQRTLVLLAGLATTLDPQMQPMTVIRPYVEELVLQDDQDWAGFAKHALKDLVLSALSMPDDMRRVLGQARRGELRVEVGGVREGVGALYHLGQQLIYGLLLCGAAGLTHLASVAGNRPLTWAGFAGSVVFLLGFSISWRRGRALVRRASRAPHRGSPT